MECRYVNCGETVDAIVLIDGMQYPLCNGHFQLMLKRMKKIATTHGEADLNSFRVRKEKGKMRLITKKRLHGVEEGVQRIEDFLGLKTGSHG